MEKGGYKTGQLLGVKEKRGKLVREYVAGFFGEEPIIKQRLLTPQEARRYREDVARGKEEGKSETEAVRDAGQVKQGAAPKRKLVRKKKTDSPRKPLRKKSAAAIEGTQGEEQVTAARPARAGREAVAPPAAPQMQYVAEGAGSSQEYIQNLINSEPDKPNFNPANTQAAVNSISKIGCPEMKIYRIGSTEGEVEGQFYSQKEYLARTILGLPLWKPKPEIQEEPEAEKPEAGEPESKELVAAPEPDKTPEASADKPQQEEPETAEQEA